MKQRTIRLIKAWGMHGKGETLTLATPIADLLIESKRAEAVSEKREKPTIKKQAWVK